MEKKLIVSIITTAIVTGVLCGYGGYTMSNRETIKVNNKNVSIKLPKKMIHKIAINEYKEQERDKFVKAQLSKDEIAEAEKYAKESMDGENKKDKKKLSEEEKHDRIRSSYYSALLRQKVKNIKVTPQDLKELKDREGEYDYVCDLFEGDTEDIVNSKIKHNESSCYVVRKNNRMLFDSVKNLRVNEMTPMIKTDGFYYRIKLKEKHKVNDKALERQIQNTKGNQEIAELLKENVDSLDVK